MARVWRFAGIAVDIVESAFVRVRVHRGLMCAEL